jgi:hypothetical protein
MDDATSTLMQLRFVISESTFSYFEALDLYLAAHGRARSLVADRQQAHAMALRPVMVEAVNVFDREWHRPPLPVPLRWCRSAQCQQVHG